MADAASGWTGRRLTHYLLERRLGEGGMGEVYLARDLALERPAAVKILRADPAGDLAARARREALLFARLQHPWIATFYEAGESDGVPFLAMEYVPGESLRSRLRSGPLAVDAALEVAACLLEALAHAHAAGILHRDIKPENVMLTGPDGRHAKLLDFGIALLGATGGAAAGGGTVTRWTDATPTAGTSGYAAPEQLRGASVDGRADLFAVGALLYEAASGRPAFPGGSAAERIAATFAGPPPPVRGPGIPEDLDGVIRRALATEPEARYASAAAFLGEVRRLRGDGDRSALPDTIAVTDLTNLSGDPADAWISSGIAESVASDLARHPALRVIARERMLRARASLARVGAAAGPGGAEPDALDVGHALGCRWVLAGGVQRVGPMLRITTRLTEVPTGRVVAADKLDGPLETIFALQDRIAESVAARFHATAPSMPTPAHHEPTLAAYELYARGRRLADRLEKGSFDQAQELFEEAVRIEPRHAESLAGLAGVHAMKFTYRTDPMDLTAAAAYARRSIEADPRSGDPHAWLAYALLREERPREAFDAAQRAAALSPAFAYGPYFSACARTVLGDHEGALHWFRRTVEVDPQYGFGWLGLGWTHEILENADEAAWCLKRVVELEGHAGSGPTAGAAGYLAEHHRRRGALDAARRSALEGLEAADKSDHMYRDTFRAICLVSLGRTAVASGDVEAARAAFTQAALHLRGRPRALGGGPLLVQALAGLARADRDAHRLEEAVALHRDRAGFNFSWLWSCSDDVTALELARACRAAGREEEARRWLEAARAAGSREAARE